MAAVFGFKYDNGDQVYKLDSGRVTIYEECLSCDKGVVTLKNSNTISCPSCKGVGVLARTTRHSYVGGINVMTIGRQSVEISDGEKPDEKYMCQETGVGSGNVYRVNDLWPTIAEAHKEADKRNRDVTEYVCSKCNEEEFKGVSYYYEDSKWIDCPIHGDTSHARRSVVVAKKKALEQEVSIDVPEPLDEFPVGSKNYIETFYLKELSLTVVAKTGPLGTVVIGCPVGSADLVKGYTDLVVAAGVSVTVVEVE